MRYNSETQNLGFCEKNPDLTTEYPLEAEISLPDYCPEIKRILRCNVRTDILSVQNISGRVNVQGNADITVIYIGDNDKISAYQQVTPIQKTFDSDKIEDGSSVVSKIITDYVNCRAVNPRRLDVKAMMTVIIRSYSRRDEKLLTGLSDCGIRTLCDEYHFSDLKCIKEKAFNLTEVLELPSDKPVIGRVINSCANIIVSEKKIINNKMLVKGDCYLKIHYLSENDSTVECAEHSIPISQIIEADGITEDCNTLLNLNVTACESVSKVDSSGEMKLIDINVRVSANIFAFINTKVSLISDAYSTQYNSRNSYKSIELISENTDFDTSFTNKIVLESIGVSIEQICSVWCSDVKSDYILKNGKCCLVGTYQVTVIFKDAEKQFGIISKPVDFELAVDLKNPSERINCYYSLQITGSACSLSGESKIELKTEFRANGKVLSEKIVKYLCDTELSEISSDKRKNCALTIYFCDKNEKVWNIAKKYKTTVDAILSENNLDSDIIKEKKTLLIPGV
ncbi:MAG: DUF3794 domain-containing protein [Clostridia bacterium]|nr:DUF3794 domain-containing protein [Clostridia bacterium]